LGFLLADNGEMCFFDWKSGHRFHKIDTVAQPGSLDAEQGVFCSTFDKTGLRLITGEADKTSRFPFLLLLSLSFFLEGGGLLIGWGLVIVVKVWKQDENATEETHPLDWKPTLQRMRF